ncbi:MAG: hypothetical protein H7210_00790 [Pyrinomonadaceae bacterium]|nr:hypothetical protein [Phycisphaerales bacterium]
MPYHGFTLAALIVVLGAALYRTSPTAIHANSGMRPSPVSAMTARSADSRSDLTGQGSRSLRSFGVSPAASPAENKDSLQRAIDWAASCGGVIEVDASAEPYPVASGLILRRNASLVGVHGPVGRATRHPSRPQPIGSVFQIQDALHPFITVESGTQISGVQFWYSQQTLTDPAAVVAYPPTIQVSQSQPVWGVTLRDLTFYGEFVAMDFNADPRHPCEQILIEHCYGYPLSGEFVRIDRCYDVPRVLHCHVNPANRRAFAGDCSRAVVDSVVARRSFAFHVDRTDNAVLMDLFTFGIYGGALLGASSYGQLTNFNFDCVSIGIQKNGDSAFNRNWMVAQGSIIANIGSKIEDIHPIVVSGQGHLSLSNVEAFSGPNGAVTALGRSWDFITVQGEQRLTISISGSRMRNYESATPVTLLNPNATVILTGCFDRSERLCDGVLGVGAHPEIK